MRFVRWAAEFISASAGLKSGNTRCMKFFSPDFANCTMNMRYLIATWNGAAG